MDVRTLEYGDDPEADYPEDFDSFKIFEVWSDPDIKVEDKDIPIEYEDLEEVDSSKESKRLAIAVEFSMHQGGYFFIETPSPNPDWLNKVWKLLQDNGWQGHSFNEIRSNCREQIKLIRRKSYIAVIDEQSGKAFHNRGKLQGSGTVEDIGDFLDKIR